jgi:hypothetical protein
MRRLFAALISVPALLVTSLSAVPVQAQFSSGYQFLKAVRERDGTKATEMLGAGGSTLINTRDSSSGETGLHIVTARRDSVWLRFLLDRGADANIADRSGVTPLLVAAQLGYAEGIQLLTARGARVNSANSSGETALHLAVQRRDIGLVRTLMTLGANPDLQDNVAGMSARDYATRDPRAAALLAVINEAMASRTATTPATGPVAGPH